jgi:hypothetical protein
MLFDVTVAVGLPGVPLWDVLPHVTLAVTGELPAVPFWVVLPHVTLAVKGELLDVPLWVVLPEIRPGATVAVRGVVLEFESLLPLRWVEADDFVLFTVVELPEVLPEFMMLPPLAVFPF